MTTRSTPCQHFWSTQSTPCDQSDYPSVSTQSIACGHFRSTQSTPWDHSENPTAVCHNRCTACRPCDERCGAATIARHAGVAEPHGRALLQRPIGPPAVAPHVAADRDHKPSADNMRHADGASCPDVMQRPAGSMQLATRCMLRAACLLIDLVCLPELLAFLQPTPALRPLSRRPWPITLRALPRSRPRSRVPSRPPLPT